MPVRELALLARQVDAKGFARELGPFALMQRPVPDSFKPPKPAEWSKHTAVLPPVTVKGPPMPVDFEDLLVATLPAAKPDGSLELTIGRSPTCDVVVDDTTVSSHHATITWNGKTAIVRELGSSNGTFLNGMKVGSQASLRNGDALSFGRSQFVFLVSTELHSRLLRVR